MRIAKFGDCGVVSGWLSCRAVYTSKKTNSTTMAVETSLHTLNLTHQRKLSSLLFSGQATDRKIHGRQLLHATSTCSAVREFDCSATRYLSQQKLQRLPPSAFPYHVKLVYDEARELVQLLRASRRWLERQSSGKSKEEASAVSSSRSRAWSIRVLPAALSRMLPRSETESTNKSTTKKEPKTPCCTAHTRNPFQQQT